MLKKLSREDIEQALDSVERGESLSRFREVFGPPSFWNPNGNIEVTADDVSERHSPDISREYVLEGVPWIPDCKLPEDREKRNKEIQESAKKIISTWPDWKKDYVPVFNSASAVAYHKDLKPGDVLARETDYIEILGLVKFDDAGDGLYKYKFVGGSRQGQTDESFVQSLWERCECKPQDDSKWNSKCHCGADAYDSGFIWECSRGCARY